MTMKGSESMSKFEKLFNKLVQVDPAEHSIVDGDMEKMTRIIILMTNCLLQLNH